MNERDEREQRAEEEERKLEADRSEWIAGLFGLMGLSCMLVLIICGLKFNYRPIDSWPCPYNDFGMFVLLWMFIGMIKAGSHAVMDWWKEVHDAVTRVANQKGGSDDRP